VGGAVEEVVLEPDGRRHAAEQSLIRVELRQHVRGQDAVGQAAQDVVGEQHREEREPVEDDPAQPSLRLGDAEGEHGGEHPRHDDAARHRDLERHAVADERHQPEHGRTAADPRPIEPRSPVDRALFIRPCDAHAGRHRKPV